MKSKMIVSSLVSIMMLGQIASVNVFANENVLDEADVVSVAQVQEENVVSTNQYKNTINIKGVEIAQNGKFLGNTGFTMKFDGNKIKISNVSFGTNRIHYAFGDNKYLEVKLYGADRQEKKSITLKGNDRVHTINEINNADFEYGDYIKIYHAEGQSKRYEVTGDVIDQQDGLQEYIYKITENGLEQIFSKNMINSINIKGIGIEEPNYGYTGFKMSFAKDSKKIKITSMNFGSNKIHDNFEGKKYVEVKLYGADGTEKKSVTLKGNDRTNTIMEINDTDFEYGDYIKIYHAEGQDFRYTLDKEVIDQQGGLQEYTYRITENGLQQIFVIDNEIQMSGHPLESHIYRGFKIKFDTVNKKVKVANVWAPTYPINPHKSGKYMEITLYNGKTNEIKQTVSIDAKELTSKANQFNNNNDFEYGDYLEIFHAQGVHGDRYDISGNVINKNPNKGQKYIYKITKNGLQQVTERN